jgi:serine/threonine protein phosphatase 1
MKDQGYNLFPLRGNHEQMLLDADTQFHNSRFVFPGIRKPLDLYDKDKKLLCKYFDFLMGLPFYYELDCFLLVHAGFNTTIDDPFEDKSSMVWIDNFVYDFVKLKGKYVIHGHTSIGIDLILNYISNRSRIIPLDNGINETTSETKGNLLCLDIDKMELTIQKNIEKETNM